VAFDTERGCDRGALSAAHRYLMAGPVNLMSAKPPAALTSDTPVMIRAGWRSDFGGYVRLADLREFAWRSSAGDVGPRGRAARGTGAGALTSHPLSGGYRSH